MRRRKRAKKDLVILAHHCAVSMMRPFLMLASVTSDTLRSWTVSYKRHEWTAVDPDGRLNPFLIAENVFDLQRIASLTPFGWPGVIAFSRP
jgi:hypothetical protein